MIERVSQHDFENMVHDLQEARLLRDVVVDEAHYILDYVLRPAYSRLPSFIARTDGSIKVTFLSATLTPDEVNQVLEIMIIPSFTAEVIRGSMNRPNLQYKFVSVSTKEEEKETIVRLIDEKSEGGVETKKIMIFLNSIRRVKEIVKYLTTELGKKQNRRHVFEYHSSIIGNDSNTKDDITNDTTRLTQGRVLSQFKESSNGIIVCTSGLTNGYDDDSVDVVLFVGPPHSMKDFIQGSSRGGRGAGDPHCRVISVCLEEQTNSFFENGKKEAHSKVNGPTVKAKYEQMQFFWQNFRNGNTCVRHLLLLMQTSDPNVIGYCSVNDQNKLCSVCSNTANYYGDSNVLDNVGGPASSSSSISSVAKSNATPAPSMGVDPSRVTRLPDCSSGVDRQWRDPAPLSERPTT